MQTSHVMMLLAESRVFEGHFLDFFIFHQTLFDVEVRRLTPIHEKLRFIRPTFPAT